MINPHEIPAFDGWRSPAAPFPRHAIHVYHDPETGRRASVHSNHVGDLRTAADNPHRFRVHLWDASGAEVATSTHADLLDAMRTARRSL